MLPTRTPSDLEMLVADLLRQSNGKVMLSIKEAATLSDWSRQTVQRAIHRGELTASRPHPRGHYRITVRDLAAWIIRCRTNAPLSPRSRKDRAHAADRKRNA